MSAPQGATKRTPAFPQDGFDIKTSPAPDAWGKKHRSYKPLPIQFRHHGFDYRQIAREGNAAIYRQTWKGNEHSAAFEVIRIRRRDGFQIGERFVEPAEVYPNSEAWGVDGFTFTDKDAAFAKLREITAAPNTRTENSPT